MMSSLPEVPVVVVGAGVVGAALTYSLARREVDAVLLEAEPEPALGASGTNSGILHTGFDSAPGELETELILRSAALRDPVLDQLGVPVVRCGALLRPAGEGEDRVVAGIAEAARTNEVEVTIREDGSLEVPGEAVTDPVAYTQGLIAAATAAGAELRTSSPVEAIERAAGGLELTTAGGERVGCRVAVNCCGLRADEVARMVGDESFEIYPRKGEFFVFDPPGGRPLERILLPVPSKRTKGVLAFPTVDGKVLAGPTAHDQDDKDDWSVREEAFQEVWPKVTRMLPELEGAEPIASYAGLRPAGRGCNYLIGPSSANPALINVAAIRSTGLTASLGIAEHVTGLLETAGIELGAERQLPAPSAGDAGERMPWWRRAAERGARR